ncbi:MAG: lamin tail domain-containing protein [Verrucomicrobiia bacterium]
MTFCQPIVCSTTWIARALLVALLCLLLVPGTFAAPVISEFMAANQTSLLDEDGEAPDWIELFNPGPESVDLAGWSLTDQADAPAKWRFPERILEPGAFLVVFASGKDRAGAGTLHTNFRLEQQGEFLALFPPDSLAAASAFTPAFPPQAADISFGIPMGKSGRDLLSGAPVWVLVPGSAAELPENWAEPGVSPGNGWFQVAGFGVGYDETPPGMEPDANVALAGTASQSTTAYNLEAANAIDGDPATFTHTASDDNASAWWVTLGAPAEVRRIVLRNRQDCCASRFRDLTVNLLAADGKTVIWTSGLLNPENSLGSPDMIALDLFELNVGAIEAQIVQVVRTPDPDLSGSNGTGNEDEDNVLSLGEVEVYGVGAISLAPLIRSDIGAMMKGRNSSAFARVPFVLEEPESATSLTLQMRFDDGVMVYLNGQTIAARNVALPSAWNSVAVTNREPAEAVVAETIDLLPFRSLWLQGTNWLALQGVNASADDPGFLLDARLLTETGGPQTGAYLEHPTPGAPNNVAWNLGQVADTKFSVNRGIMQAPFDLVLSTATPGAEIRYTLDGSVPTASEGLVYAGPIRIERTTVVRAAAFKSEYRPTNVDTHTYIFLEDVVAQPKSPPGFPASWAGVTADYAMDTRITGAAAYAGQIDDSLRALPSLAITTPIENLFGSAGGIYANPERSGVDWERPASLEWMHADGTSYFQVDCGLRIQGGYFRQRNVTQKHSLRLLFKNIYGPGRLRQDLFNEPDAAREFDTLVLRAGANDGYAWGDARDTEQFTRDEFGRRAMLAMGQPSARGLFVHLYLNGLYWGLYNLTERPAEDFSATYLGGEPEEWDAVNSGEVKSGSLEAWNTFMSRVRTVRTLADYQRLKGLNPDGTRNSAYPEYFDATNYIDYMLVNIWGGNWDWPNKNFWFGRHRGGLAGGFKFYVWDYENTMGNNRGRSPLDMVAPRPGTTSSWVGEPHDRLRGFDEYRIEFADRVQQHFFSGGTLAPENLIPRYKELADSIELAVLAETARWGDDNLSTPQDVTDWRRERDWILGTYLPQRSGIVLAQLRSAGLYPRVDAPVFSPTGGAILQSTPIILSASASEVYYTTDGLDPRLPGGAVRPEAIRVALSTNSVPSLDPELIRSGDSWRYLADGTDPGATWRQLGFVDQAWTTGNSPLGYGDGDEATVVGYVDANSAVSGVQKNATTFFRRTFEMSPSWNYESLQLSLVYDDAAAVYLNGTEVLRTENLPPDARFDTYATGASSDNATAFRADIPASLLNPGLNVLAVEIHQIDGGSTDISFDLELSAVRGALPMQAAPPFFLTRSTRVIARARQGDEWSALNEQWFAVNLIAASSNNLVVSEICYRPPEPESAAERAVATDRDEFEFVEVMNVSASSVDLTGVKFTGGVLFNFPEGTALSPGARIVVVRNRAAFQARYGTGAVIAGEYQGNLSNGGEEIVLENAAGAEICRVRYSDKAPWPPGANEGGVSLVLKRPGPQPAYHDPSQWRVSVLAGGSPGGSDSSAFSGDPAADVNANGQADLLDYLFGAVLSDLVNGLALSVESVEIQGELAVHFVVTLPFRVGADDARLIFETSSDPGGPWKPGGLTLIRQQRTAEGRVRESYRLDPGIGPEPACVRLSVALDQ